MNENLTTAAAAMTAALADPAGYTELVCSLMV